jgi:signal transduction histidine kinase/CheY-like chemotaxis protein
MRAVQEELNAGKNHLALILQSLGEGVIVTDGSGRVLLSNIRALEYLDVMPYDGSHIIMSDLLVNCSDEFCSKFKGGMERGGIEQIIEFEVYGKHVAQRYLRMIVNSLESVLSGSPETIYLIQDISREKEIDRIKNEFISNLSHELRTPMNAILGISRMLSDKNAENLYDRQKQGLSIINESGHRLLSLINDILDLSKIEAGKMEIVARRVKVRDIIDHITKITAPLVSPGVVFKSFISPEVPDDIVVDDLRVQQVILNLVGNSLKFTSDGSVELSVAMKDGMIVFSVADTGIGIAEKDLPFVFERFKQGDGSMARKYQGTGIGLSLSREIVSLMGGTISAESVYGQGTVMRFDVPMGLNTEEQNEILSSVMPDMTASNMETFFRSGLITLLVVEDEDAGRETLRFILADRFNLIFAENGKEAVKSFNENRIDLVLMDIMMPEMDGYHVYDAIRKTDYGKYVPIVAVTARAMMGDKDKIIAHGFDAYVSKPIDSELLIVTIMNLLKTRVEGGYYD